MGVPYAVFTEGLHFLLGKCAEGGACRRFCLLEACD